MAQFNQLYNLVHKDRTSPQLEIMERELLAFCRAQAANNNEQHDEQQERGRYLWRKCAHAPKIMDAVPIEAAWDSDNNLLLKLLKSSIN